VRRLIALAVALSAVAPTPAVAQGDEQGIAFRDERGLRLTWPEARTGAVSQVCNLGADVARDLDVAATGFGFAVTRTGAKAAAPVADDRVVTAMFEPGPDVVENGSGLARLAVGKCWNVRVARRQPQRVDTADYKGLLTVVARGDGIARRRVTLAGPKGPEAVTPAKAAAETLTLKGERGHPIKADTFLRGDDVLLLKANSAAAVRPAAKCQEDGDEDSCPLLGHLYNGSRVASVWVAGPATDHGDDPTEVPIRVTGATVVGDYAGALDLASTPAKDDDDIKVSLAMTDWWPWAVLALLVGAAVAFLPQFYWRRVRPRDALEKRVVAVKTGYDDVGPHGMRPPPEGERGAGLCTAIGKYVDSTLFFDTSSDAFKALDASITEAEKDVAYFNEPDGLKKSLDACSAALAKLVAMLPRFGAPVRPSIVAAVAGLIKARTLKAGESVTLAGKADAAAALLDRWRELADDVLRFEAWWRAIAHSTAATPFSPDEHKRWHATGVALAESRRELGDVKSAGDLERLDIEAEMRHTYEVLASLGAPRQVWKPSGDAEPARLDLGIVNLDAGVTGHAVSYAGPALTVEKAVADAKEPKSREAEPVVLGDSTRRALDAVVVAVTVVVAVIAGLAAFYFGEIWGTLTDYLTVIAAGTAAQALLLVIVDLVGKLLPPAAPELIVSEGKPAKIAQA
jgi:hypothetical protein